LVLQFLKSELSFARKDSHGENREKDSSGDDDHRKSSPSYQAAKKGSFL